MNPTIEKFGYPATLIKEYDNWLVLLRPAQVTLGSLVLAAKSDVTAYGDLPEDAFAEQAIVVAAIEHALRVFTTYERINYLMLMMVDPNVHFHVIPRYSKPRTWNGNEYQDVGWPGPPRLDSAKTITDEQIKNLTSEILLNFR